MELLQWLSLTILMSHLPASVCRRSRTEKYEFRRSVETNSQRVNEPTTFLDNLLTEKEELGDEKASINTDEPSLDEKMATMETSTEEADGETDDDLRETPDGCSENGGCLPCFRDNVFTVGDQVVINKPEGKIHGRVDVVVGCGKSLASASRICLQKNGCWAPPSLTMHKAYVDESALTICTTAAAVLDDSVLLSSPAVSGLPVTRLILQDMLQSMKDGCDGMRVGAASCSKATFAQTTNGHWVLKVIKKAEVETLRYLMSSDAYATHFVSKPSLMIPFTLEVDDGNLVAMPNFIAPVKELATHVFGLEVDMMKFDVKPAQVWRSQERGEFLTWLYSSGWTPQNDPTLRCQGATGEACWIQLTQMLSSDIELLTSLRRIDITGAKIDFIDYSLAFQIATMQGKYDVSKIQLPPSCITSHANGNTTLFCVSLLDYLMEKTWGRSLESWWKAGKFNDYGNAVKDLLHCTGSLSNSGCTPYLTLVGKALYPTMSDNSCVKAIPEHYERYIQHISATSAPLILEHSMCSDTAPTFGSLPDGFFAIGDKREALSRYFGIDYRLPVRDLLGRRCSQRQVNGPLNISTVVAVNMPDSYVYRPLAPGHGGKCVPDGQGVHVFTYTGGQTPGLDVLIELQEPDPSEELVEVARCCDHRFFLDACSDFITFGSPFHEWKHPTIAEALQMIGLAHFTMCFTSV